MAAATNTMLQMVHGLRSKKKPVRYKTIKTACVCSIGGFNGLGSNNTGINHWRQYILFMASVERTPPSVFQASKPAEFYLRLQGLEARISLLLTTASTISNVDCRAIRSTLRDRLNAYLWHRRRRKLRTLNNDQDY